MSDFSVSNQPTIAADFLVPTAEDLAARSLSGGTFSVSNTTTYPALNFDPEQFNVNTYDGSDLYTTTQTEIPPMNNIQAKLTDEKNKPYLIGAGVLLAVGAVYFLGKNKKGKK